MSLSQVICIYYYHSPETLEEKLLSIILFIKYEMPDKPVFLGQVKKRCFFRFEKKNRNLNSQSIEQMSLTHWEEQNFPFFVSPGKISSTKSCHTELRRSFLLAQSLQFALTPFLKIQFQYSLCAFIWHDSSAAFAKELADAKCRTLWYLNKATSLITSVIFKSHT